MLGFLFPPVFFFLCQSCARFVRPLPLPRALIARLIPQYSRCSDDVCRVTLGRFSYLGAEHPSLLEL